MSPGFRGLVPLRPGLLTLIAVPVVVGLLALLTDVLPLPGARPPDLDARAAGLSSHLEQFFEDARRIANDALVELPQVRDGNEGTAASRLEGVGLLGARLAFEQWAGSPPEPDRLYAGLNTPHWTVRRDGARTRLVVWDGPDPDGRVALASFLLDSALEDARFDRLIPERLRRGVLIEPAFTASGSGEPDPATRIVDVVSPDGTRLGELRLQAIAAERLRQRSRGLSRAWAAVVAATLLLVLFRWSEALRRPSGLALAWGALVLGRGLLLLTHAPALLLPRELGTASLFGTSAAFGLLASPADLLLSALVIYLGCLSVRVLAGHASAPRRAVASYLTAIGTGLLAAVAVWLTRSVADNSRVPLLDRPEPWHLDARTLVAVALALVMLGAAELFATWRGFGKSPYHARRLHVVLALIPLALACSIQLQQRTQHLAVERLRAELAPQVLEQSRRRSVALSSAVHQVSDAFRRNEVPPGVGEDNPEELAYHFWVTGELFYSGYKSSLGFYVQGSRMSHFSFDLPVFAEDAGILDGLDSGGAVEEVMTSGVEEHLLLRVRMPVRRGDDLLGVVVGHVLDEPDNLPFLPWSRPYLAALGPGGSHRVGEEFGGGPQYVLYDEFGTVVLTTLARPPADAPDLRRAAAAGRPVRVHSGEERYLGLALEQRGRLHLLLLADPEPLERLAASARLLLLALIVLALLTLLPRVGRPEGIRRLAARLRGSFHRKLLLALLLASVIPLVGLALFLQAQIERGAEEALDQRAIRYAGTAQRVLEDYSAVQTDIDPLGANAPPGVETGINDELLDWLRKVVGQELHVYKNGLLLASSKRELFTSGLVPPRLEGDVQRALVRDGLPYLLRSTRIGPTELPVAYAPVRSLDPHQELVVAVLVVVEQHRIARATGRATETILLATVILVGLLAVAATYLARTVARPVRELVEATSRIAGGDYATRLAPRTRDEVAELVHGFNSMAASLASQRSDLEARREYMERLLQHATMGVVSLDAGGGLVTANPAAHQRLAAAADRLLPGVRLVDALAGHGELAPLRQVLAGPAPEDGEPQEIDLEIDGEPRRLRLVRVALPGPDGVVGTLLLIDDVTDTMRSSQLAAWAEMARAIAHEIKNPLTPIQLSTEHLRRLLDDRGVLPSEEIDACLGTVIKQVRALYDIAGDFSTYARLPGLAPEPLDPVAFVRDTLRPYRDAHPPGVTIEERYEPSPQVMIDRKVLSRALVNLLENALQAMTDGGRLRVGVAPRGAAEVALFVADDGPGLDTEVRRRLFEPYFSTKSSGTGLGLAIARRSVEAHDGRIEIETPPDGGTAFQIVLPAIAKRGPA